MTKLSTLAPTVVCCSFLLGFLQHSQRKTTPETGKGTTVSSLLIAYGEPAPLHFIGNIDEAKVRMGEDIVKFGNTVQPSGGKSKRISSYFVCTDCHSTTRETAVLSDTSAYGKLSYAQANKTPYVTASPFFGIYNREHWFNGDYPKKYGDKALNARDTLAAAIQLCATRCSSGRMMEAWELEAVLHYFASLQLKLGDLDMSDEEWEKLNHPADEPDYKLQMAALLKSKYITASPATFASILPVDSRKFGDGGNADNGKVIFEQGCMHCHRQGRVTKTVFGDAGKNATWLVSYFRKSNGGSIYNITRTGTEPSKSIQQYMPVFTKEKLTNDILEDLAAYLTQKSAAEKK